LGDSLAEDSDRRSGSEEALGLGFANSQHPMWVFDQTTLVFLAVNEAAIAA
jgi:PAS domain S-box-containing protein